MAIKAGQIIHDAEGFVIDRIQTGGPNNLNIPQEKIYELGNYQTVATIRDIPDLSFEVQSLDVSTEIEALICGKDPTAVALQEKLDFGTSVPLDIVSPFLSGIGAFDVVAGIAIPYLTLEQVAYRFGVAANAEETFTLRGDSIYYVPGTPYFQSFARGSGTYSFAHTALLYQEKGADIYALSVCWHEASSGKYARLYHGSDYTDTSGGLTIDSGVFAGIPSGAVIKVVYGSATAGNYPQNIHQDASVKPAAIRGKDIDVFVGLHQNVLARWTGVQSFEATRRVTLQNDQEFGNYHYISSDYDVADVTGTLGVKARDVTDLITKVQEVTNVGASEIAGTFSSTSFELEARIYDPSSPTPSVLKTIYVPDARFTPPAGQGRVQQKLETNFPFTSDAGLMYVYRGTRPTE